MKVLIVASYNKNRYAPFIVEQAESLREAGCDVIWFGIRRKGVIGYLREVPRLRKMIHEERPDVIHAHYGLSCLVANMATRCVPVVSTYHGSDINNRKVRILSKIAIRLSAWNIFVSQRNMDLVGADDRKKCSLIPCGVTLSEEQQMTRENARKTLGWNANEKKVLFAGALDNDVKDPGLAQQAMEEFTKKGVKAELVELKGYSRQQVNTLMCACNCILMTSKTEGSPQVIKEAMVCGCPIVSVDVGDVAERTDGVEGCYIVKSREPRELAEAIEKALAFTDKTKGREKIIEDGLSNHLIAKRIIATYEHIIGK